MLLSRCSSRASPYSGFSCCGTGALGVQGSVAAAQGLRSCGSPAQCLRRTGLVVPQHERSSLSRDRTHVSCIGKWIFFYF